MKNTKIKGVSNAGLAILSLGLILGTGIMGAGNFFTGVVQSLDSRLTDTEARIAFLGEELGKAKDQAAFDRELLDKAGQANAARDDKIESLSKQIGSLEAEIMSLKAKIGDLQREVADVRTRLATEGQVVECADPYDECQMPAVPLPEPGSDQVSAGEDKGFQVTLAPSKSLDIIIDRPAIDVDNNYPDYWEDSTISFLEPRLAVMYQDVC